MQHPLCSISHLAKIKTTHWFIDSFHWCFILVLFLENWALWPDMSYTEKYSKCTMCSGCHYNTVFLSHLYSSRHHRGNTGRTIICLHHILPLQLKAQRTVEWELAVIRHHNWSVIFFLASVLAWMGPIIPWHLSITLDWFCLRRRFSVRLSKVTKTRREQHRYCSMCSRKLHSIYVVCLQTFVVGSISQNRLLN